MRVDFVKAMEKILDQDKQSLLITGDLGYKALEKIVADFDRRFLNAGISEQNMIGLAAGMAMTGLKPWVYSIIPFLTYRSLEQIRNDLCLHDLPVKLVGNGGGYTYGIMGSTHHALEDIGILKSLPNMHLFFPCGNNQVASAVQIMNTLQGPSYLRLAVSAYNTDLAALSENPQTLTRHYAKGSAVTVIGVGHAVHVALHALVNHADNMKNVEIFSVARFPFDPLLDRELIQSVERTQNVIVVEEHYQAGGMVETLRLNLPPVKHFDSMNAIFSLNQKYGSPAFHLKQSGLTPEVLLSKIQNRIKK